MFQDFKSNFSCNAILTGGGVLFASTPHMYVICVYLLCASEHEIESQSNEILLSVHTFIHIVLASYTN